MSNKYFIDTNKFSIDKFRKILKTKEILPGRVILKNKINEKFDLLKDKGINSLGDLIDTLKTKSRIEKFSNETGLTVEYLTILRREANSYVSVPVNLRDLPFVETEVIYKLEKDSIKDSKQLFDKVSKQTDRTKLADQLKIPHDKLFELPQLSDLVRITGVGPVFARIIYDSGIRSVREFLSADKSELFERVTKTNNEKGLTKAKFSIKDIEYCLELGKELPLEIE